MGIRVEVQYAVSDGELPLAADIERWADAALDGRAGEMELTVRIVDADESARLNELYRRRAGPTNVLSFPFEPLPGVSMPLLGDLVICAPVVQREATEQGKGVAAHWAHMVVHGVLHLLGYEHGTEQAALEMEDLEISILAGLGYPNPYLAQ